MKKLPVLVILVAIVAGIAWAAGSGALPPNLFGTDAESTAQSPAAESPLTVPRPADASAVTVDYVHDGDTLFVIDASGQRLKVRLIGIDTPEIGSNAECFGAEATERLRAILPVGSTAWATADAEQRDRYDRSLFYLWTDSGEFVNLALAAEGYATPLTIRPNDRYEDAFAAASSDARSASAGLWGAC